MWCPNRRDLLTTDEIMMTRRHIALSLATLACLVLLPAVAFAQSAVFDFSMKAKTQTDQGYPSLTLRARELIESGKVTMKRSDGKTFTDKIGRMRPGNQMKVVFQQPKNSTFKWQITVEAKTELDQTMTSTLEAEASYVDPIELAVDRNNVKVADGKLILNTNRPLKQVAIEVFDNNGNKFAERTQQIGGRSGNVEISWPAKKTEVGAIRLKATDVDDFWAGVILEPFWVEIPHREVIFDNGKATWQPEEEPKLEETLKGVRDAMKKHKKHGLNMQLYIAGYTDTVGGNADNMKLSQARARAIAKWFKRKGLKIDLYYQGFGESVLAKQTADNVPEPLNRRALYVLGNAPPPRSGQIPRGNWKKL
jgi:outer membrane protein OmpA-like peptidoglycan-associated protein